MLLASPLIKKEEDERTGSWEGGQGEGGRKEGKRGSEEIMRAEGWKEEKRK